MQWLHVTSLMARGNGKGVANGHNMSKSSWMPSIPRIWPQNQAEGPGPRRFTSPSAVGQASWLDEDFATLAGACLIEEGLSVQKFGEFDRMCRENGGEVYERCKGRWV